MPITLLKSRRNLTLLIRQRSSNFSPSLRHQVLTNPPPPSLLKLVTSTKLTSLDLLLLLETSKRRKSTIPTPLINLLIASSLENRIGPAMNHLKRWEWARLLTQISSVAKKSNWMSERKHWKKRKSSTIKKKYKLRQKKSCKERVKISCSLKTSAEKNFQISWNRFLWR